VVGRPFEVAELELRLKIGLRVQKLSDRLVSARANLEDMAKRDPHTGVLHRTAILDRLRVSADGPVGVLLIEVDHYRTIEEKGGPSVAEAVLAESARRITRALRGSDTLGRYGESSFLAVLPHCDATAARAVAERIRASIEDKPLAVEQGALPLSASIGISSGPAEAFRLVRAADTALGEARRGRHRVVAAAPVVL
jgi:two-component system cell cycle response regulator